MNGDGSFLVEVSNIQRFKTFFIFKGMLTIIKQNRT